MQEKFIKSSIYVVVGILALILFLSVPYNFFCKATNYCHPITFAEIIPHKTGKQKIEYHFKSQFIGDPTVPLKFYPKEKSLIVLNGKLIKNSYYVKNFSNKTITIKPMFKTSPIDAAKYIDRIECLCMKEQTIKPGEQIELPVRLRMNLDIEQDKELNNIKKLEISYLINLSS